MDVISEVSIRVGTAKDMPAVLDLIKELAVYEEAADEVIITSEQLVVDGFGPDKIFDCFVAERAEEVIGFALYYTSYSTWKGKSLYLEDFLVTKAYRRQGIGKLLFDAVHRVAKERKVARFEWQVLDWNKPAIEFYKKYQANLDPTWINCKIEG